METKMNERIQELADQSEDYADADDKFPYPSVAWLSTFKEKFAELIVRECAQQAHDLADMLAMHRDKSGSEIAESVGNTIKEHFGVSE
jgi:hypothetical protein